MSASWDQARAVADAVLYEGYLLYPYRASSRRTSRAGSSACSGRRVPPTRASVRTTRCRRRCWCSRTVTRRSLVVVRFLQLQHRGVERDLGGGRFEPVDRTRHAGPVVAQLGRGGRARARVRPVRHGRARGTRDAADRRCRRAPTPKPSTAGDWCAPAATLHGELDTERRAATTDCCVCTSTVRNTAPPPPTRTTRSPTSLIGTHLIARGHRRRVRVAARTARAAAARWPAAGSTAASRCSPGGPASTTWCWSRRSSSTTTRRSPNRARARCTTPPRSTRSSPCG